VFGAAQLEALEGHVMSVAAKHLGSIRDRLEVERARGAMRAVRSRVRSSTPSAQPAQRPTALRKLLGR
jgi:DnaJ-domain-containing protein 1